MDQKTTVIVASIIFFAVGLVGGRVLWGGDDKHVVEPIHEEVVVDHDAHSTMDSSLGEKTGDEFDKAFIDEMIVHHEGAVIMGELARERAEHQEIRDMAEAIITTQTAEIEQMKEWRRAWYGE